MISFMILFFYLEGFACTPPTKFFILKETLKTEVELYEDKVGDFIGKNSSYFEIIKWNKKLEMLQTVVGKKFPPSFIEIFNEYEVQVKKINALKVFATNDSEVLSENDRKKINELFAYNFYILVDILPNVVSFREFSFSPIVKAPNKEFYDKGIALQRALEIEFSPNNLLLCKDAEGMEKKGTASPDTLASNMKGDSSSDDPSTLPNPPSLALNEVLKIDYNLINVDKSSKTLPRADMKGNVLLKWIKNFFAFLNPGSAKKESVDISSETYLVNMNFISVHQQNLNIKERYLQWENDRNFWIERSKNVSGYKIDVFTQKFIKWTQLITDINSKLDDSLKNIEVICQNQDIPIKCWNGSNKIPQ